MAWGVARARTAPWATADALQSNGRRGGVQVGDLYGHAATIWLKAQSFPLPNTEKGASTLLSTQMVAELGSSHREEGCSDPGVRAREGRAPLPCSFYAAKAWEAGMERMQGITGEAAAGLGTDWGVKAGAGGTAAASSGPTEPNGPTGEQRAGLAEGGVTPHGVPTPARVTLPDGTGFRVDLDPDETVEGLKLRIVQRLNLRAKSGDGLRLEPGDFYVTAGGRQAGRPLPEGAAVLGDLDLQPGVVFAVNPRVCRGGAPGNLQRKVLCSGSGVAVGGGAQPSDDWN